MTSTNTTELHEWAHDTAEACAHVLSSAQVEHLRMALLHAANAHSEPELEQFAMRNAFKHIVAMLENTPASAPLMVPHL